MRNNCSEAGFLVELGFCMQHARLLRENLGRQKKAKENTSH